MVASLEERKVSLETLNKWSDSFKIVANNLRLAVLFMLYGSEVLSGERKSLTFGQIRRILGFPNTRRAISNLSHHLSTLVKADFVEKEPLQIEKGKGKIEIVYHLSQKGRDFLRDFRVVEVIENELKK